MTLTCRGVCKFLQPPTNINWLNADACDFYIPSLLHNELLKSGTRLRSFNFPYTGTVYIVIQQKYLLSSELTNPLGHFHRFLHFFHCPYCCCWSVRRDHLPFWPAICWTFRQDCLMSFPGENCSLNSPRFWLSFLVRL